MENENVTYLSTSGLLIDSGVLLTLLRFSGIIQTQWSSIFHYWTTLVLIFIVELVIVGLVAGIKWLIKKVAK